jgi:acetyl/propionyl-CoA carboxylase alpha subunit
VLEAAALYRLAAHNIPAGFIGFRLNAPPRVEVRLQQGTETYIVSLNSKLRTSHLAVTAFGDETVVFEAGQAFAFTAVTDKFTGAGAGASDGAVLSPMPGHILSVAVAEGDVVVKGAALLVMEAMKMEMTLTAPIDGAVTGLTVKPGERVAEGVVLLRLEAKA